jgi:hypothetical protein
MPDNKGKALLTDIGTEEWKRLPCHLGDLFDIIIMRSDAFWMV